MHDGTFRQQPLPAPRVAACRRLLMRLLMRLLIPRPRAASHGTEGRRRKQLWWGAVARAARSVEPYGLALRHP
eukprot:scaffold451_cov124-Isochrysis_galbana.AAC.4